MNVYRIFGWFAFLGLVASSGSLMAQPTMTIERLVTGLSRPVYAGTAPGDNDRLFILEQRQSGIGRIKIFNLQTGTLNAADFLSISGLSGGNEQGLLGLAFHPDYQNNGLFYVNITTSAGGGDTVIREYQRTSADVADPNSARDLLTFNQPFSNHNGGWLEFDSNDYLFIGSGDGGSGGDPQNNGQNINSLLGKILRIDPLGNNSTNGQYGIPASNPFVGVAGADEIWAYGIRNPWRCCFDSQTGDLYIGDVGQNAKEEIDVQPASSAGGENYGWRIREGTNGGSLAGAIDPIYDYDRGTGDLEGFSVTGGRVYRGPIAALNGHYFFADYVTDRIWSMKWDGSAPGTHDGTNFTDFIDWSDILTTTGGSIANISSFGEDNNGNLYIVDLGGEVFRISSATIPTTVLGRKFLDGTVSGGQTGDLNTSDDNYLEVDPSATTNPFKQSIDILVQTEIATPTPSVFSFRVEARMNGGPVGDVTQQIRLFNVVTKTWEDFGTTPAQTTDDSITVTPTGDLSRFVNGATNEVTARVTWKSEAFAGKTFFWTVDIDQIDWPTAN